jgi:hypothetical protein
MSRGESTQGQVGARVGLLEQGVVPQRQAMHQPLAQDDPAQGLGMAGEKLTVLATRGIIWPKTIDRNVLYLPDL